MILKNRISWGSHRENSVFGYEASIAEDTSCHEFFKPNPLFIWLEANHLNDSLFKALDKFCPLYPLVSYYGQPSIWLSPPPSGAGNTVGIIIGRDSSNRLRIIGSNFINNPAGSINVPTKSFFDTYDSLGGSSLAISRLIENEISSRMTEDNFKRAKEIEDEAFKFRTMPIYILVIDDGSTYLGMDVALVTASRRPSDMSYEYAGEII